MQPAVSLAALVHVSNAVLAPLGAMFVALALVVWQGRVPLRYNLRNLLARWRTTMLTGLAFTAVIALLTVMLAFVEGMAKLTEQTGHPGNVVALSSGATDELFSNLGYSDVGDIERQPGVLRTASGAPLCSKEVYAIVNQPLPGKVAKRRFMQVRGIEDVTLAAAVHDIKLVPGGEWFSEGGVREKGKFQVIEAVLGAGVAQQMGTDLGRAPLRPGDLFELHNRQWLVTGVMESKGNTFGSEVWAKRSIVGPLLGKETYSTLILRTQDAEAAKALSKELTERFKKASIQALPETEYFARLGDTSVGFLWAIGIVTCFMAVGGVFGVMNTMFAAINVRVKDIGVMRILGYARWQILVSFLIESMALALVGGLLGCALGSLANGLPASSIAASAQGGAKFVVLELVVNFDTVLVGMLLALGMGLAGGILPAISAMRLRPLESMR